MQFFCPLTTSRKVLRALPELVVPKSCGEARKLNGGSAKTEIQSIILGLETRALRAVKLLLNTVGLLVHSCQCDDDMLKVEEGNRKKNQFTAIFLSLPVLPYLQLHLFSGGRSAQLTQFHFPLNWYRFRLCRGNGGPEIGLLTALASRPAEKSGGSCRKDSWNNTLVYLELPHWPVYERR